MLAYHFILSCQLKKVLYYNFLRAISELMESEMTLKEFGLALQDLPDELACLACRPGRVFTLAGKIYVNGDADNELWAFDDGAWGRVLGDE